jgi:hypothetical protein
LVAAHRIDGTALARSAETSTLVLVTEHVWATGLRDAVMDAGGVPVVD